MTASPGRIPAATMVFTSAATSLRMSLAILVPSRILAGIQAPGFGFRASARKSYTAEATQKIKSPQSHRDTEKNKYREIIFLGFYRVSLFLCDCVVNRL